MKNFQNHIIIEIFPSLYGDSFLVSINPDSKDEIYLIIDCGFGYKEFVLPKLIDLKNNKKKINKFIISHYDRDHIEGAISFFEENGFNIDRKIIEVEEVWLNTYRHLQLSKRSNLFKKVTNLSSKDNIRLSSFISEKSSILSSSNKEKHISSKQAINLGSLIYGGGYSWNKSFKNKAVSIDNKKVIKLADSVSINILSPNNEKLEKLEGDFERALYKLGIENISDDKIIDDAYELFVLNEENKSISNEKLISSTSINKLTIDLVNSYSSFNEENDPSNPNGSSIAFILKNNSKKILFLADAHFDIIISSLKELFPDSSNYPIFFDAIKVSHHGSKKNNSKSLYEIIDSPKFIFSTNGKHPKHKHPDIETICTIINRPINKKLKKRDLIFNYDLDILKLFEDSSLKKQFNYEISIKNKIEI